MILNSASLCWYFMLSTPLSCRMCRGPTLLQAHGIRQHYRIGFYKECFQKFHWHLRCCIDLWYFLIAEDNLKVKLLCIFREDCQIISFFQGWGSCWTLVIFCKFFLVWQLRLKLFKTRMLFKFATRLPYKLLGKWVVLRTRIFIVVDFGM